MNIKNKNYHKNIFLALVVTLILLAGGWLLTRNHGKNVTPPTQTTGPTPEQKQVDAAANADAKQKLIENTKPADTANTEPTHTPAPDLELTARQEVNGSVTVFTKLHSVSSGTCTLVVKNGAKQTTQSANVIYQSQYSSCAGFSVPVSGLGVGNWEIVLTVSANGQTYTKNLTYEVK